MKTQYYTATSLDGFIATEGDSLEWLFPLGDIGATGYPEFIAGVGTLPMGSATYEWMLRNSVGDDVRGRTGTTRGAARNLGPGSISIKCQAGEVTRCRPETWS